MTKTTVMDFMTNYAISNKSIRKSYPTKESCKSIETDSFRETDSSIETHLSDEIKESVETVLANTGGSNVRNIADFSEAPISVLLFTEDSKVNSRIISELGFNGINTIGEFLSMDMDDFGKRYGVGTRILKLVKIKMDNLLNHKLLGE